MGDGEQISPSVGATERSMFEMLTPNGNIYGRRAVSMEEALDIAEQRFPKHSRDDFEPIGRRSE